MSRQRYDVRGRVALVTGGARGMGLDTARRLSARGARVAIADVDGDEAARAAATLGGGAVAHTADVTDAAAMAEVASRVVEGLGGIDVAVANAGIEPPPATMLSVDPEQFRHVLDVNLHGVWHTVKAALPHVVARRGHLVLVASAYAFMNGTMAAPYALSKAAVEAMGRALRTELAPHGASASVAYFGFIDTDLTRRAFAARAVTAAREALPAWLTRPVEVGRAGEAIVRGIERRSARVTAPGWVAPAMVLRGVIAEFDDLLARDRRLWEAIRVAESETQAVPAASSWPRVAETGQNSQ